MLHLQGYKHVGAENVNKHTEVLLNLVRNRKL